MRIIPVIDVKAGQVVHAVGGRRDAYRPIASPLVTSSEPRHVAQVFRQALGLTELYLADLDAIAGAAPDLNLYRDLAKTGAQLFVDAGVHDVAGARAVHDCGVGGVVVGLEAIAGPEPLREIAVHMPVGSVWFSLDLKGGRPLGQLSAWRQPTAESIAAEAVAAGVRQLIVLDLASVGEAGGPNTEALCRRLNELYPDIAILAGGGVRDASDLENLARAGVAGALVATALHAGTIRPSELAKESAVRPPK